MSCKTNKNPVRRFFLLGILISALFYVGCSDDEPIEIIQNEILVEYTKVFERTQSEIEILISLTGFEDMAAYMLYDITVYSITYKTKYLGEDIIASGLVAFPRTEATLPILSFQHGTITRYSDAPTIDLNLYGLLSSMASAGYIFCVPDFVGFGSSTDILHPYYHYESTARCVLDILRAGGELSRILKFNFNGEVFLAGYSEGGYATMAAHKMMEEENPPGLALIASAPASGGYDLKGMQNYFFNAFTYHEPYYLAYVALSYKQVYGFETILSDIFQESYATEIPRLFDGLLSGEQINRMLTDTMSHLLQPDILVNIDTDSKYNYLNNAFEENSLLRWVPENRLIMYHGTADITVPYQNSIDTYVSMLELGASDNTVSLVPLTDADHNSGIYPYIVQVITSFDNLK